jgi:hypothetical protein
MERVYKLHKRTYKAKNYDIIGILLAALITVQNIQVKRVVAKNIFFFKVRVKRVVTKNILFF